MIMKFNAIELRDFQCHKNLEIALSPKITSITGRTDAGKSAILRALRWACLNDFPGDDFIRDGAKQVTVTAHTIKNSVERSKGIGGNLYKLNTDEFKSFGQSVPEPIAKVLNLNEINFQGQMDSPFWFSLSAPEVSRQLNRVIDLSIIDTALSNIAAEVRRAQERKTVSEERLKKAELELERLEPQRQRIYDFQSLKKLRKAWVALDDDCHLLEDLINKTQRISITHPPDFKPIESAFSRWRNLEDNCFRLNDLITRSAEQAFAADALKVAALTSEKRFHKQIKGTACPLCSQLIK